MEFHSRLIPFRDVRKPYGKAMDENSMQEKLLKYRIPSDRCIKADKAKSTEKIDGAIAMIMALDRAIRCGNEKEESVYDSRGLLVL